MVNLVINIFKNIQAFMRFRTTIKQSDKLILNKAGGKAYQITPKTEFLFLVLTSFLKDKFYESANQQLERLKKLISEIEDKQFIARVAIFARNEFGMRTVSHVIAVELILGVKNEQWVKNAVSKIIRRPDDILEIVAYYLYLHKDSGYKKGLPANLRKAIQISLSKFDEYQLAKYKGSNTTVKMVDILNLVHPKPGDFNKEAFNKLIKDELKCKNTWESEISAAGQNENKEIVQELKNETWKKLIVEKKIGYFALLRNLRNIIQDSPESIDDAISILIDQNSIKKSLVLPFRFLTALEQIEKLESEQSRKVVSALNKAAEISMLNVPKFDGNVLVALDVSGSMQGQPINIGSLFASILFKNNKADLILFSDNAQYYSPNEQDGVLSIANLIKSKAEYAGTNFHSIFSCSKMKYDRIIILSDMQGLAGGDNPLLQTLELYKKKYQANPLIYSFDLNGYGTIQFPQENIYCLAGFSEKVFDFMKSLEKGGLDLIDKVNSIEL